MNSQIPRKPHIVFYFSDTGGGHRSAAEAIIEAIQLEYKDKVTTEMVDFFKNYAPRPFNRSGPEDRNSASRCGDEQAAFSLEHHGKRLRLDFKHAVAPPNVEGCARLERRFAPNLTRDDQAASLIHGRNHGSYRAIERARRASIAFSKDV